MTLPVNADLIHVWQTDCHAPLILYFVVVMQLRHITLFEEFISSNITFPVKINVLTVSGFVQYYYTVV